MEAEQVRVSECKPEKALVNKHINLTSWFLSKSSFFSASEPSRDSGRDREDMGGSFSGVCVHRSILQLIGVCSDRAR